MESIKLPPRLEVIAGMVPDGAKLADVGTDHGLVPIRLLQEERIRSAVASDIRAGPLSRAMANAAEHSISGIRFVQCDGLSGICPEEADTIVIAGMGGETIASILKAAPWSHRDRTLILQPMSHPELLRMALADMSLRITRECLVKDSGKIYSVIKAIAGAPVDLSEAEKYVGKIPMIIDQDFFSDQLEQWEHKFRLAVDGLSRSSREEDAQKCEKLLRICKEIHLLRERSDQYANGRGDSGISIRTDPAVDENGL